MKLMQKQQGFTLVELIIVIVILGILAVTAAPKFLNVAGDAKSGVLESINGSFTSVNNLISAKAKIRGVDTLKPGNNAVVTEGANSIYLVYGYPLTEPGTEYTAGTAGDYSSVYTTTTLVKTALDSLFDLQAGEFVTTVVTLNPTSGAFQATADGGRYGYVVYPTGYKAPAATDGGTCYAYLINVADAKTHNTIASRTEKVGVISTGC